MATETIKTNGEKTAGAVPRHRPEIDRRFVSASGSVRPDFRYFPVYGEKYVSDRFPANDPARYDGGDGGGGSVGGR